MNNNDFQNSCFKNKSSFLAKTKQNKTKTKNKKYKNKNKKQKIQKRKQKQNKTKHKVIIILNTLYRLILKQLSPGCIRYVKMNKVAFYLFDLKRLEALIVVTSLVYISTDS